MQFEAISGNRLFEMQHPATQMIAFELGQQEVFGRRRWTIAWRTQKSVPMRTFAGKNSG
jgi:hypothetical protein